MKTPPWHEVVGCAQPPSSISLEEWTPEVFVNEIVKDNRLRQRFLKLDHPGDLGTDLTDPDVLRAWLEYAIRLLKFIVREMPKHNDAIQAMWPLFEPVVTNLIQMGELVGLICDGPTELPAPPASASLKARPNGFYRKPTGGTFVYVARRRNEVLYVGITDDVFHRMTSHRHSSAWWAEFTDLSWEEWPDRRSAETQECRLILRHCPRFNIMLNPGRLR